MTDDFKAYATGVHDERGAWQERMRHMIKEIEDYPAVDDGEKAFKAVCLTIIQEYTKET